MNPTHGAGQTGSDVTSGLLTAANSDEGLIVNLTNFAIPTDSDPVFARRIVERVKTVEVPAGELQTTGYELYTREDNEEGIVVRHLFNRDGSHSDNEELSGLKLVQAELQTGVDLNGDGEISLNIESKLTTDTASGSSHFLYGTNEGLLISTRGTLLTEGNPFSGVTTGVEENQFTLLLNEAGDAVFNLDSSDIQQVVQRKERDTSTNTATNVTVHAGYDLYTRNSAGDVRRFSFGTDGRLQGSPTSLEGSDLLQEEASTRLDLSGSNGVGTTIRERLVTGVAVSPLPTVEPAACIKVTTACLSAPGWLSARQRFLQHSRSCRRHLHRRTTCSLPPRRQRQCLHP